MSRVKNLRRTKDKPRNDLRTPNHQKSTFVKIAVSFPSLIPCLSSPTDDREMTERRAKHYRALAAKNSALFLRLLPNKVVLIPKKVDSFPKTVDYIPKIVAYPPNKKIAQKLHFSCTIQNNSLPLQPKITLYNPLYY